MQLGVKIKFNRAIPDQLGAAYLAAARKLETPAELVVELLLSMDCESVTLVQSADIHDTLLRSDLIKVLNHKVKGKPSNQTWLALPEDFNPCIDREIFLALAQRLATKTDTVIHVPFKSYSFRVQPGDSVTSTIREYCNAAYDLCHG